MARSIVALVLTLALVATTVLGEAPRHPVAAASSPAPIALKLLGTYTSGLGAGAAETVAYDRGRIYITNAASNSLDIVDISSPSTPRLVRRVDLSPFGASPNSVDADGGTVAVAIEAGPKTDPGSVVFFDRDGDWLADVLVGALPDMLTFTPDGRFVLVANEGEPNSYNRPDSVDPEGTVSIINVRPLLVTARARARLGRLERPDRDATASATATATVRGGDGSDSDRPDFVRTVDFRDFNAGGRRHAELSPDIRVFGPNATVAQDLEPEYITVSADARTAYVTLQENNAIAVIDVNSGRIERLLPLGHKDHSVVGASLDASDQDGLINIRPWPVKGMYQPDAVASYRAGGATYLVTANEGDARDYPGFSEEARIGSLNLDPAVFPNAAELKQSANLGRLNVTRTMGLGPNGYSGLYAFGARSFSIWRADTGARVWDSGDRLERITGHVFPGNFNASNSNNTFDNRSDDKGPEPEGIAVGTIEGRTFAFVGLERIGGVMVFDVTNPREPAFVQYTNNRDFTREPPGPDSGAEVVRFVPAGASSTGRPLLLVANEVSGTVSIYEARPVGEAGTLTLLHNNDGESSLLPIQVTVPGRGTIEVGSAAAYKAVTDREIRLARAQGNAVLNVYAGDSFLASATLACSLPPNPPGTPVYDAVAQRQIAYDLHVFGNHEFDYSPDFLKRFIQQFEIGGRLDQPFLSGNLDFSREPGFADLIDGDGLIIGEVSDGRVVARAMIVQERTTGQRFGVVAATTPLLPTISTPRNVTVTPDLPTTATLLQSQIDRLTNQYGIRKIILVSHLQDVGNDRALVKLLRGVDVAVAGGGDELLSNPAIPDAQELLPGDTATPNLTYPLVETDAAGRPVYIVTTAGNYKYVGRLDVTFDDAGEVSSVNAATSYPRRVVLSTQTVNPSALTAFGIADAVTPDPGIVRTVARPVEACLDALAAEPVARSEVLLDVSRAGVRTRETNAGNLIADSFVAAYDRYAGVNGLPARGAANRVIAVTNGGGIRQNAGDALPTTGAPGTISRLDVINVLPFDNFLTVVRGVTPAELKTILERSGASLPGQGGQFLQVSGFRVTYDVTKPVGNRVSTVTLEDGTPIVAGGAVQAGAPSVSVVTNSFTASGGDDFPTFAAKTDRVRLLDATGSSVSYEQAWREYLQSFPSAGSPGLPTIPASDTRYAPPGEGRITVTGSP